LFVVVQHPFADVRSLIGSASGRLARPSWPLVEPRVDFVRSFGQVSPRLRGGVSEWAGEEAFCRANSALRFPNHLREIRLAAPPLSANIERVFRRFNSAGTVTRFETGLQLLVRVEEGVANAEAPGRPLLQLLEACAELPARVRDPSGQWQDLSLIRCGPALAKQYLRATTDRKAGIAPQPWWFAGGTPAILVENVRQRPLPLPRRAERVLQTGNIDVFHWWGNYSAGQCSVWYLQASAPEKDVLRRLRIHLLRLHAERQCLRQVITLIARGTLQYSASAEVSEATQDYLNEAIRAVERSERAGFEQSGLLEAAWQAVEGAKPGENATLTNMRRQVAEKVKRFIERSARGVQMNTTIQIGTATVTGDFNVVTANNIKDSFNKATGPGVSEDLKKTLAALTVEIGKLAAKLPQEEAEKVTRDLQTLATEATSKSPRKAWYELSAQGLVDAAKTVAEMAGPVTTAVRAVLALLA
jgi:hypothetical protein